MDWIAWLGYVSAFLTTAAFLPQVLRVMRTRSTTDISLMTFVTLVAGMLGWLAYGVLTSDLPIILANGITLVLAGTILAFKIRHTWFKQA